MFEDKAGGLQESRTVCVPSVPVARVILPAQKVGEGILANLAENREKISSAHAKVKAQSGHVDVADATLTRMSRWLA